MAEHSEDKSDKNWRRHGARYKARRRAVDILFEAETRDIDPVSIVDERETLSQIRDNRVAPIATYTREIVVGAAEHLDEIDGTIARYLSENWELHRLPSVDRAVLRVGAWELLYNPDVPTATAVVDGVEIAHQYSTDAASPYIHAVLDDIAQSRSADNPMNAAAGSIEDVDEDQ